WRARASRSRRRAWWTPRARRASAAARPPDRPRLRLHRSPPGASQREHHAAHELLAIEVGAAAILLHKPRHLEVHALVGGEALLAARALAPPARGVRLEVRRRLVTGGFSAPDMVRVIAPSLMAQRP